MGFNKKGINQEGFAVTSPEKSIELPNGNNVFSQDVPEGFEDTDYNWSEPVGSADISRQSSTVDTGSYSIEFADNEGDKVHLNNVADTDSPTEGVIQTAWRSNSGTNTRQGAFFRYQDINNFYLCMLDLDDGGSEQRLWKWVNGSQTKIAQAGVSLSQDTFHDIRFMFYEGAGTVYYRLYELSGSDWVQIGTELSDGGNSLTGGGGMGLGDVSGKESIATVAYYHDETEIYY